MDFGLRLADHSAFVRGGNLSLRKLPTATEGLPFSPRKAAPVVVQLGYNYQEMLHLSAWVGGSFINQESSLWNSGFSQGFQHFHLDLDYYFEMPAGKLYLGTSYLAEDDISLTSVHGGIHRWKLTWLGEAALALNYNSTGSRSLALYQRLSWRIIPGLDLSGEFQYYDPEIENLTGAVNRFTFGMNIYPLNMLEIVLQTRFNETQSVAEDGRQPEILMQIHNWF